jgi:hypothetical protein
MRDHPEAVEIDFEIVGLIAGVLGDSTVGTDADQADAGEIALAPVPLVEVLEGLNAGADEPRVPIAEVDALHAPGEQRGLGVGGEGLPVGAAVVAGRVVGLDEVGDHAVHEVRLDGVPALLEVPVVLEDAANDLRLAGQEREQVDDEHGVPEPLADEAAAGDDPCVLERRVGREDLAENAGGVGLDCEVHQLWRVGLKEIGELGGENVAIDGSGDGFPVDGAGLVNEVGLGNGAREGRGDGGGAEALEKAAARNESGFGVGRFGVAHDGCFLPAAGRSARG